MQLISTGMEVKVNDIYFIALTNVIMSDKAKEKNYESEVILTKTFTTCMYMFKCFRTNENHEKFLSSLLPLS